MAIGLRERRKQEARQAISGAAMALFEARGFDEVTISQVADAAGVSKMTVTNYFPRKEDLVFDRAEAIIGSLAAAAAARAPGESLLAAIRRDYAERIAAGEVTLGPPTAAFARMVAGSHVLTSRFREIADLREQALGDAIAAESGTNDPQQRIVAASSRRFTGCCSRKGPGASWPASHGRKSARRSRRLPARPLTCSSRPLAATPSEPERPGCSLAG